MSNPTQTAPTDRPKRRKEDFHAGPVAVSRKALGLQNDSYPTEAKQRPVARTRSAADPTHARFLRALDKMLSAAGVSRSRDLYRRPSRSFFLRCAAGDSEVPHPEDLRRRVSPRIGRVLVYVEEHLEGPLSLDRLADEADLSKYYFARRFREEVGRTPWAYVRQARIERAKRLLEQGASPAEAAFEVGFFDQSHLTNAMQDIEGMTPRQYQREHRQSNRKEQRETEAPCEEVEEADRKNLQE